MAIYKYPDEVNQFIAKNVVGKTTKELVELVNNKFGTEFTAAKMKSYKANHGLKSGIKGGIKKGQPTDLYPENIQDFIQEKNLGVGHQVMADMINKEFGTAYSVSQIKAYRKNRKISSGLTGRFEKGNIPPNKGEKGCYAPGSEKGWFKKGDFSFNRLPIGSERLCEDGYTYIKIQDGHLNRNWKAKHIVIWERHNGTLPEDRCILFGDKNKQNFDIENLICVTRPQLVRMNQNQLIQNDADLTRTGVVIADLIGKISTVNKKLQSR